MFHVFGDSVDKSEFLVPSIEVAQPVFMHTELYVIFAFCFMVDNEKVSVTPICDKVLISQILQGKNIGDVVFSEPHMPVVAWNLFLMWLHHGTVIAPQTHYGFVFFDLIDKGNISKKIHSWLTIKENNIPQV